METPDRTTLAPEPTETDFERRARIEREAVAIAAGEAAISAGHFMKWSEFKAELVARDNQTMLKAGRDLVAGP